MSRRAYGQARGDREDAMVDFGFTKVAEDEKAKLGVWSGGEAC